MIGTAAIAAVLKTAVAVVARTIDAMAIGATGNSRTRASNAAT